MAPDSNSVQGLPPGPSLSVMTGTLAIGLSFRNAGSNCLPVNTSTGWTV